MATPGPNTGGMGAYSPAPVVTPEVHARAMDEVILPTLRGMAADGMPYTGFLYAGLMVAPDGSLKVLEFNCRFGDPETQPIMLRLKSDLPSLCLAALEGRLHEVEAKWDPRPALGVVMAAGGYPFDYVKGDGHQRPAGRRDRECQGVPCGYRTGGRRRWSRRAAACCVSRPLVTQSRRPSNGLTQLAERIHWDQAFFRRDIGHRAIRRS